MGIENPKNLDNEEDIILNRIRERAKSGGDVTFDLNRYFGSRMRSSDPELLDIQKEGFITDARKWIESTSSEGMKYGTASFDERIEKAREMAKLAGTTIEEIAEEYNLELPDNTNKEGR